MIVTKQEKRKKMIEDSGPPTEPFEPIVVDDDFGVESLTEGSGPPSNV